MIYGIEKLTAGEIVRCTGGRLLFGDEGYAFDGITTDSRTVSPTALYIPLKGERFDGHSFLADVCAKGIGGYICSDGFCASSAPFAVEVADTGTALLDIAAYYRSKFDIKVIGLTGSVGKTTTKELVASVVAQDFRTLCTKGNFNNNVGVPLTIFGLESSHEAAVIEMGMSNFGEIEVLTRCARPDIAIITNIGTSHIEYLGSREGILKAKCEIFEGLKPGGKVILNGDDPYLASLKDSADCDYVAYDIVSDESGSTFKCNNKEYKINLAGIHNIYNALSAIAAGEMLGMSYESICGGLSGYHTDGIRQNIVSAHGYKVINDCYNASPQSMIAELDVLCMVEADRRIAVLGDIAELGANAEAYHREVGAKVASSKVDVLVTVGKDSAFIASEASDKECHAFDTAADAAEFMKGFVKPGDAVLVKASRCMRLEQVSEALIK